MIVAAIAIVSGCVCALFTRELPDRYWISLLPILLFFAVYATKYRFLLLLTAAYLWASLALQQALDLRLNQDFDHSVVKMRGIIDDLPEKRNQSLRFMFKPESIDGYPYALPKKIRLSWYHNKQWPKAGERWQFETKLKRPHGYQNPGGFDYERWLLVKGVGATGYVKQSAFNQRVNPASAVQANYWRSKIARAIDTHCPECTNRGFMKALTIGYRGQISNTHRAALQETGTAHLLAISGLHVGMVAAIFFVLGRLLWRPGFSGMALNRLELCSLSGLIAAIIYAAMAGFSLPTVRALIMLSVIAITLYLRIGVNLLNSVAIALVVILVFDPMAVGSSSLWLSFGALFVIAFAQYILARNSSRWQQSLTIQMFFSLLFLPLNLILFGQIQPASFVANIIAIPLIGLLVLPVTLVASVCALLNLSIAEWLFWISDFGLTLLVNYLTWLKAVGLSALHWGGLPLPLVLGACAALVLLLMPSRPVFWKPACLLLLMPLLWQRPGIKSAEYRMTVLDVGMGTSIVIETRRHSLVYDFGPGNELGFSAGERVLGPFLRERGIHRPDIMVISHVDQDHSGGFITYKDNFRPAFLLSGTPAELAQRFDLHERVKSCHEFAAWSWDGVDFEFLAQPGRSILDTSNNRSCVLKVSGYHQSLLTGDIESGRELSLLQSQAGKLISAVIVVPHHGSLTSSSAAFVQAVKPSISIFTVGKNNRWGFPKKPVVDRYEDIHSKIYRTDRDGAVTVSSRSDQLKVVAYRHQNARPWF